MLEQLFSDAVAHECDAILICGDIYDKMTTLKEEEKDLFIEVLGKYDGKLEIVLINGQHDMLSAERTHLSILKELVESKVLNTTTVVEFEPELITHIDGCDILAIPYGEYTSVSLSDVVTDHLEGSTQDIVVGMFHGMLKGCFNDLGKQFDDGVTLPSKVNYWALGDIHKQQKLDDITWYPGSPIQHNFGEVEQGRGYLLVEVTSDDLTVTPYSLKGIKPLINIDLDEEEEIPEDAYVKLTYTDRKVLNDRLLPANVVKKECKVTKIVDDYSVKDDIEDVKDIVFEEILKLKYTEDVAESAVSLFVDVSEKY